MAEFPKKNAECLTLKKKYFKNNYSPRGAIPVPYSIGETCKSSAHGVALVQKRKKNIIRK